LAPRPLLMVKDDQVKSAYMDALAHLSIDLEAVSSLKRMHSRLKSGPYNGLILDVPTMMKSKAEDRELVHDFIERFPTARVRYNPNNGRIVTMFYGQVNDADQSLEAFLINECASFAARSIRAAHRRGTNLNVLLYRTAKLSSNGAERTATLDLSEQGCFIFSGRDWQRRKRVWLRLPDLGDDSPIRTRIRRRVDWGGRGRLPGIGVVFESINQGQLDELKRLLD